MKKMLVMVSVFTVLLMGSFSFAACDNACTSEQYTCARNTNTMYQNSKGTLGVAVTNQQSQAQSVTAELLGSWFMPDVTQIAGNTYNTGQATSLDFSVTPTSDGSQAVCVRMGTTCTVDCGSVSVSSPASLSISSLTSSSDTVTVSNSFTVSATIQNGGTETAGSTTAITANLSVSSGSCTISSTASKTVGTIVGKSSSSQSWNANAPSSAGSCTFSLATSGTNGGSDTKTKTVTISSGATTTTTATTTVASGGSTGGPTGGATGTNTTSTTTTVQSTVNVTRGKATISVPVIAAGKMAEISISNVEETGVRKISVTVANAVNNVQLTVTKSASQPAEVTKAITGNTYQYLSIEKSNLTDSSISSAKIEFAVDKSWISANNIGTVYLNRFTNNDWTRLTTTKLSEDNTYAYYSADTPGFSVFAITGEVQTTTTVAATTTSIAAVTTAPLTTTLTSIASSAPVSALPTTTLLVVVAVIVIMMGGVLYFKYFSKPKAKSA